MARIGFSVVQPKASQSGISVVADTRELAKFARSLRRASPEAWAAYRAAVRVAAEAVAADARSRAGFSTRIPATIKVRVLSSGNIEITAGGDAAPDAAPLENKGKGGTFRHPVFGNREVWVNQPARPFLAPALEAHREEVAQAIEDAVMVALNRAIGR